ncbi:MAG: hypothetical protein EXR71_19710 [Myxococcales bacterium]|nr:hypothetical protein [Myxococcales bacterium]
MWQRLGWDRLLVLLVSLGGLWPFGSGLRRGEVPGQQELPIDGGHGLYIYALVGDALRGVGSLLHTDAMWFPTGRPLLLTVQNVIDAVAAQPFLSLLGPQVGLATFAALILVSNGLAGGWLGERVGGRGWAGPAAAVVLAMSPYVWGEAQTGRVTQTLLAPMAVALGHAWTAVDARGGVRAGVWLGVAGLGYWFYGFFGAVVVAAVVFGGLFEGGAPRSQRLAALGAAALSSLVIAAPFALLSAASWGEMAGVGTDAAPIPNATRLGGGFFWIRHPRIVAYIPQCLYLVGLLACAGRPRGRAVGLAVATLLLCLTAAGETIRVADMPIPTPLALMKALPGFDRFWWPHRALAGATVALAALAAVAAGRGGWVRRAAGVGLALTVAQGVGVPGALSTWRVPPRPEWADSLAPGAVLLLPMLDPEVGKVRFAEWIHHRRPLVNGMSMWDEYLWPAAWRTWADSQPLVKALLDAERARPHGRKKPNPHDPPPVELAELPVSLPVSLPADAVARLAQAGVGTIVAEVPRTPILSVALLRERLGEPTCDGRGRTCWWVLTPGPPPP